VTHPHEAGDVPTHPAGAPPLPPGWLGRWPWVTFVAPFVVFMLVGSLEPTPPNRPTPAEGQPAASLDASQASTTSDAESLAEAEAAEDDASWLPALAYRYYPVVYTVKIVLTLLTMALVWPGYRTFPWRVTALGLLVGLAGGVLWIVLAKLQLGAKVLGPLGLDSVLPSGQRSAFNPLKELAADPAWAYGFLAIRLVGLAVVVPIIEEFFLRGFLMRFAIHDQWHQVPFGAVTRTSLVVGTVAPMLMHPGELVAAAVWFSLISWLMVRTKNIWDCVAAHAVTNAMLGGYVLWSGDWWLM
jgi:CAAX prenyl protease-like protein